MNQLFFNIEKIKVMIPGKQVLFPINYKILCTKKRAKMVSHIGLILTLVELQALINIHFLWCCLSVKVFLITQAHMLPPSDLHTSSDGRTAVRMLRNVP